MLVDSVEVKIQAGRGGDGIVAWRHEKYVPKGGPDGGDGGRGGDVYLLASDNVDTLRSFKYRAIFKAEDGERGSNKKRTGKNGENLELLVPTGTVVEDLTITRTIADLVRAGERVMVARGGKGGFGNIHFSTSTEQNPRQATQGLPGQQFKVRLELRSIADIALIGLPNAGKSTLLTALTGAQTLVADYPFSTTEPRLGVFNKNGQKIVLVDLPGLIEGAYTGKGLGDQFLRHAERVRAFIHLADASSETLAKDIETIVSELKQYGHELATKPRQLVLNKTDLLQAEQLKVLRKKYPKAIFISADQNVDLDQLENQIFRLTN